MGVVLHLGDQLGQATVKGGLGHDDGGGLELFRRKVMNRFVVTYSELDILCRH